MLKLNSVFPRQLTLVHPGLNDQPFSVLKLVISIEDPYVHTQQVQLLSIDSPLIHTNRFQIQPQFPIKVNPWQHHHLPGYDL